MLRDNLVEIKERMAGAAARAGRSPAEIKLVAVSKRVETEKILAAVELDQYIFGENYVQEAQGKISVVRDKSCRKAVFHFIGRLQSNKAGKAAELFDVIETVDRVKLGLALDKHGAELNKSLDVLVQVNVGEEQQKTGVPPDECESLLQGLQGCRFLKVTGLMTMPPYFQDPEKVRPYFRQLRQLAENLESRGLLGQHGRVELSMGMSNDFEVAIEEGATLVRIGTALFGSREP